MPLLVIDEGQNLSGSHLEILRTFLSFETPTQKLIDVVIFAQPELEEKILRKRNLAQRVGMDHKLNPLNRRDTAAMIAHRLARGRAPRERAAGLHRGRARRDLRRRRRASRARSPTFARSAWWKRCSSNGIRWTARSPAEVIGRRVFTGTDVDGRAIRQVQRGLGLPEPAAATQATSVISMADERERRRGA